MYRKICINLPLDFAPLSTLRRRMRLLKLLELQWRLAPCAVDITRADPSNRCQINTTTYGEWTINVECVPIECSNTNRDEDITEWLLNQCFVL